MNRIFAGMMFLAAAIVYHAVIMRASPVSVEFAIGCGLVGVVFLLIGGVTFLFGQDS